MSTTILTTYYPKALLAWLPELGSNEFKVFINLCSWTDRNNRIGRVFLMTLSRGMKGSQDAGCNMSCKAVRRNLKRLVSIGAIKYKSGQNGIAFKLLEPSIRAEGEASPSLSIRKESSPSLLGGHTGPSQVPSGTLTPPTEDPPLDTRVQRKIQAAIRTAGKFVMLPSSVVRSSLDGNTLKLLLLLHANSDRLFRPCELERRSGISRRHVRTSMESLRSKRLAFRLGRSWTAKNSIPPQLRELPFTPDDVRTMARREIQWVRSTGKYVTDDFIAFVKQYAPEEGAILAELQRQRQSPQEGTQ